MDKNDIKVLISLAAKDGKIDESETKMIHMIGKANMISYEDIEKLMKTPKEFIDFSSLTDDSRFENLYHIIQLMKVDGQVSKSEVSFCETLAEKLGYKKDVIGDLSRMIYSDPNITTDRNLLMSKARKHLKR